MAFACTECGTGPSLGTLDGAREAPAGRVAPGRCGTGCLRQVHEAVIGDERIQADHEKEAAEEGMHHGGGGDDAEVAQAGPGEETELVYTFKDVGELLIGCHEPGHYGRAWSLG